MAPLVSGRYYKYSKAYTLNAKLTYTDLFINFDLFYKRGIMFFSRSFL